MIPEKDFGWYGMYVRPEKYDVSKWGEYHERIQKEHYNFASEEESVRINMRIFHKTGSSKYGICMAKDICDKPLDHLFDYLQTDNLVTSTQQMYKFKDETELLKELKDCKVLIVTANENERDILHYRIVRDCKEPKITRIIFGNVAYFIFQWGKYKVAHVHQHQMGSNRDLGMRKTLEEVFSIFRPNVVFSMGVAFGIDPTTQNIGDVLVSHKVFPYSENKVRDDLILPDRSQDKVIDSWLDVRFVNTTGFLEGVTYGSILSGGSVLSSDQDKVRICRAYSKQDYVVGGEMEGSALFQLCASYDIPCAVIKGICDWGSCKNGIYSDVSEAEKEDKGLSSKEELEKEAHLKKCAQAFAMSQVFEKCDVLFRDHTLFSHPKSRAVDAERKTSRTLMCICMAVNLLVLLILISSYFSFRYQDMLVSDLILIYVLIGVLSLIGIAATLIVHFLGRNRYLQ